ncbi:MAG: diguanylate cyclase [Actinomycetota bacterium]
MELRRYGQILRRRWAIALTGFVVTVFGTLALVMPQPWVYESAGSLVVAPRPGLTAEELIRALETLNGNPTIPGTYAQVAASDFLAGKAQDSLLTATDASDAHVESTVVIDTNVIDIVVTDADPEVARDMALAVIDQLIAYANEVDDTYLLQRVEEPNLPDGPSGPNKRLMAAAGIMLGFGLALGLALLAEYLRRPAEELAVDDPITGLRNEIYLRERLHEELARTRRTQHTTAVCLVRVSIRTGESDDVSHAPTPRDLRRIARGLRLTVAGDAVLASLAGGVFVVLLPDAQRARADGLRDGWEAAIRALLDWASQGELGPRLQVTGGTGEIRLGRLIASSEVESTLRPLCGPDLTPPEPSPPALKAPAETAPAAKAPAAKAAAPKAPAPRSAAPARATVVIPEMPAAPAHAMVAATPEEAPTPAPKSAATRQTTKRPKTSRPASGEASATGNGAASTEDPQAGSDGQDVGGSSRGSREETSRGGDRSA